MTSNRKLKIAFIACGTIVREHVDALKGIPEAEIVAGCDIAPEALKRFPGLPLYGAQGPMEWTRDSQKEARTTVDQFIARQRATRPVAQGMPMLPVVQSARLDGLPAVGRDKDERISLPSLARRDPILLVQARERLRTCAGTNLDGVSLEWKENLEEMLGGEKQSVALIHMDGNDLGKCFAKELEAIENDGPEQGISRMRKLSTTIQEANEAAFGEAWSAFSCTKRVIKKHRNGSWSPCGPWSWAGTTSPSLPVQPWPWPLFSLSCAPSRP